MRGDDRVPHHWLGGPGWQSSPEHAAAEAWLKEIATPQQWQQWVKYRQVTHEGRVRWCLVTHIEGRHCNQPWANSKALYDGAEYFRCVYLLFDAGSVRNGTAVAYKGKPRFGSSRWCWGRCLSPGPYGELPMPPAQVVQWLILLRANEDYFVDYMHLQPYDVLPEGAV